MQKISRAKIKDVAQLAGVSTATVSRTLSRPDVVKSQTREAVLRAVKQLEYSPSSSAQALALGLSHSVGYVVPTLDHAIFSSSTQAMQKVLRASGIQLLVASHEYDPQAELDIVKGLLQRGVDALILVGTDHSPQLWSRLKAWSRPVFLTWSCANRYPSIGFDNQHIGRLAAEHLLALGHRDIGIVSGQTRHNDRARDRIEGFRTALAAHGLQVPEAWLAQQPFSLQGGAQGLRQLLAGQRQPTAIFCGNDLLAAGAVFEAQRLGIAVPQQLSVLGVDNHDIAQAMVPALTTVSLATQDLGTVTAEQVMSAIEGKPVPRQSWLPFELIERDSTCPPATGARAAGLRKTRRSKTQAPPSQP